MTDHHEPVCGGTDRYVDKNAPHTIQSNQMTGFFAESEIAVYGQATHTALSYISATAIPAQEGTFCHLSVCRGYPDQRSDFLAWIKEDLFPQLVLLTKELNFAAHNGVHSNTHGLPKNFGGSVRIAYASGETIHFSNNQQPVFSLEAGEKIENLFLKAMHGEKMPVPSAETIKTVRFAEERADGGFSRACLTETPEGKFLLKRESKYGDSSVYTSEQEVPRERMEFCREAVRRNILFAFAYLPQNAIAAQLFHGKKTLTLVYSDGREAVIPSDRLLPDALLDVLFEIELDLVSK